MQARGKKNLVISQELAGPVGLFVKFSVLQEYGVDRVFLLENANIDSSQRNVVFLVRGEKAQHVRTVAGRSRLVSPFCPPQFCCPRSTGQCWDISRLRRFTPTLRDQSFRSLDCTELIYLAFFLVTVRLRAIRLG